MALATLSDALPTAVPPTAVPPTAVAQPALPPTAVPPTAVAPTAGLSARLSSLADALGSLVADLDPGLLLGRDAAALYGDFARLERLVVAGKTLLAPRIAVSGHWEAEGHRSPASLLATLEGGTAGQAKRTLETGQRLSSLPSTEEALRRGTLSGPKAAEITHAASLDPSAESSLLAGSESEPLHVVKERCHQVRATSSAQDPLAALARIHAQRTFTSWTDAEGAFCFQGRDTAERGARLLARLVPTTDRLRRDRRAAAATEAAERPTGSPVPPGEPEAALRADAFYLLVTGRRPVPPSSDTTGAGPTGHPDPGTADGTAGGTAGGTALDLGSPDDLVTAPPPATVMVRVDLEALRRGTARPGELSAIDGHGPVPVATVTGLMDDAFLALVFTEAGDIRSVSHLGRTINQHLRTGLAFRDRCCVVPGCGVAYGLEIDHVVPMEEGGVTALGNLALLCRHHHRLKTYDGWVLARHGPTDADPGWTFTPQPPFGQEPGLGIDRPPEAVPRA